MFDELWKKYSPQTFVGKTKTQKAEESIGCSAQAQMVLRTALSVDAGNSTEVQKIFQKAQEGILTDPTLTLTQKTEVVDHIRTQVYTKHGTLSEQNTSSKVMVDEQVVLRTDDSFYTIDVCKLGTNRFVVVGKVDRIEENPDGTRTLVEIKNRANRLFGEVVEYEFIQIQVYLKMLGLTEARLVEQYNDQVLSHKVVFDAEMWETQIMPGLEAFCTEFHQLMRP